MPRADAILTADWHLRLDNPICRIDNLFEAQLKKIEYISKLQKRHRCPILHSGDLFHYWKPSPELLSILIDVLPEQFYTVYGNHDLAQHNIKLAHKSGIYLLEKAGALTVLDGTHWDQEVTPSLYFPKIEQSILVWHKMVWQDAKPYPGCTSPNAIHHLKNNPEFTLIVTGDNHTPFVESYENRLLVNPGSLSRQSADQIDFKPRVYLWYAESNTVEPVYLPIDEEAVSRDHIDIVDEKFERVNAFVDKLNGDWEVEVEFEKNLESMLEVNQIKKVVKNIIYAGMEI